MAFFDDIDYRKTLARKKLVFKTGWLSIADDFAFFFGCAWLSFSSILMFREADLTQQNDRDFAYGILAAVGLLVPLMIYKKITEKRLKAIDTALGSKDVKLLIEQTFRSWGCKISVVRGVPKDTSNTG